MFSVDDTIAKFAGAAARADREASELARERRAAPPGRARELEQAERTARARADRRMKTAAALEGAGLLAVSRADVSDPEFMREFQSAIQAAQAAGRFALLDDDGD